MNRRTKQEYKDLLNETVKYYSDDVSRRSTNGFECRYFSSKFGIGTKCAVGRCMDPSAYQPSFEGKSIDELNENIDSLLQDRYRGFDVSFWAELQLLHDMPSNWTETGLSPRGIEKVKQLEKWIDTGVLCGLEETVL